MKTKPKPDQSKLTISDIASIADRAGMKAHFVLEPFEGRIYHRVSKLNCKTGQASALCYQKPHAIPNHERWTLRNDAVSCPKCRKILSSK